MNARQHLRCLLGLSRHFTQCCEQLLLSEEFVLVYDVASLRLRNVVLEHQLGCNKPKVALALEGKVVGRANHISGRDSAELDVLQSFGTSTIRDCVPHFHIVYSFVSILSCGMKQTFVEELGRDIFAGDVHNSCEIKVHRLCGHLLLVLPAETAVH